MSNERDTAEVPTGEFDNNPETGETVPVPEYETEQYLPTGDRLAGIRKEFLRKEFGRVRTHFKTREEEHATLQRYLNQAHMGTTYDVYLTRTLWYTIGAAGIGAIVGLVVAWGLAQAGLFASVSAPWTPPGDSFGGLVNFLSANKTLLGSALLTLTLAGTFGAATWYLRYYYPNYVVDSRRRNINITLPHVIVYMYALSFGGMDFVKVIRRTAQTEATYGEVAVEFDAIVKDIDMFGADLFTALRNARNLTPSESMEQFLDDMLSMLDSGGDVAEFLREEANKHQERAVREQERFLNTLELLSEVFIVGFVAAPLFFIVTLLMMGFLGQNTLPHLFLLVYAIIPLGMIGFLVLISTLSNPYRQPSHDLDTSHRDSDNSPSPSVQLYPNFQTFRRIRFREQLKSIFSNPTRVFREEPLYTLAVTIPLTAVVVAFLWNSQTIGLGAFFEQPFEFGVQFLVVPFLILTVPLVIFHELEQRRKQHVARRLPDTLDLLASANQMGLSLSEGLDLVSRNVTGSFADELANVRNDIEWNADVQNALLSLANRLEVPQLTRTCNILAEGTRSTGDLHKILSIAAEDTRQRYRLQRNRKQELQAYTTVVILGFLVYLAVIVILEFSFLGTLTEQVGNTEQIAEAGLITISSDTITLFRALFFHSALIMALGTGLISGKLTDNSILGGLKFTVGFVILTTLVFVFI